MISDPQEKTWAMACHLAALAGLVVTGIGFALGPLVVWLLKKDQYPAVNEHGKESLNFQLSMLIYMLIAGLSIFVLIGFVLLPLLVLLDVIMVIVASIATSNGQQFRYPLTIRFLQ